MFDTQSASKRTRTFSVLTAIITLGSLSSLAQAPSVVADAQQLVGSGFSLPQSIAVSSNGTIYVADTKNSQIAIVPNLLPNTGSNTTVTIPSNITPALAAPDALAVDANGDLFIADSPAGGGRIIELTGDGAGNLTGAGQVIYAGSILSQPIALAVDSAGTIYIGDFDSSGNGVGQIFTIALGGTTPAALNTGLPTTLIPAGLTVDSGKNLYIADNNLGGIYKLAPGGTAVSISLGQFVLNGPSGVKLDTAGNLFVLTQLGSSSDAQVVEIPVASPATPYILPSTSLGNSTAFSFDPQGNIDILTLSGNVVQLAYRTPVNMGSVVPSQPQFTSSVLFNFELNTPKTLRGFQAVTEGDAGNELTQSAGGTCTFGNHTTVGGLPVTAYNPYVCSETYTGTGIYPGLRKSAIEAQGAGTTILAAVPVYQTTFLGAQVIYPLTASVTVTGLKQPQALALSGLDKTLYIADTVSTGAGAAGAVYSTNGPAGTRLTRVNTGRQPLLAPSALAVDGAGNLFIADFDRGDVIEVPPASTGGTATAINTGGLLAHPIALAFDLLGNLYIGDAGPAGVNASSSQPGFIVEVPLNGSPSLVNIPGVSVVFPQALATDPYTATLFIGDGGDPSGVGQVVELSADKTTANLFPVNNVTNPTGLGFDAADNLYVLDGNSDTITAVAGAQLGNTSTVLPFDNSTLSAASALAVSAGGQSFVVANIGAGSNNNLLFLNGDVATLNFGNVTVGQSANGTATISNIGNVDLTLAQPPLRVNTFNPAFGFLGSSTCYGGLLLDIYASCTMNLQFTPSSNGLASINLSILSDGYNSGSTFIAEGTGVGGSNIRRGHKRK